MALSDYSWWTHKISLFKICVRLLTMQTPFCTPSVHCVGASSGSILVAEGSELCGFGLI